jgi:hypothetical protein
LQILAAAYPHLFDVTLAQWPAWLAPDLNECLAAEVASLRITAELLSERDALDATVGVQNRLRALTIRHRLRLRAPHAIDVHRLALGLDAALAALDHPVGLLGNVRWDDAIAALNDTASALRAEFLAR